MLAYVFWHWKRESVPASEYETAQRAFHAALGAAPPEGYLGSRSFAVAGYPWLPAGATGYEDWYLVNGSAALDPLNHAAVTAGRALPHHQAAGLAAGGVAGLYRLKLPPGNALPAGPPSPTRAQWFAKPAGMSYDRLWPLLDGPLEGGGVRLWIRHMTLGPSPEFCLQSVGPIPLPAPLAPLESELRAVWS